MTNTKPSKVVIGMAYRLFDFDIFDGLVSQLQFGNPESSEESSGTESGSGGGGRGSGSGGSGDEYGGRRDAAPKEDKQFITQMFGISETGNTCCIYITD